MVDAGLQENGKLFTANDCAVGGNEKILMITGLARSAVHTEREHPTEYPADPTWQAKARISGKTP